MRNRRRHNRVSWHAIPMYKASCHCGAAGLELARKPRKLTACKCSIFRRYGAVWAYFQWKSITLTCSSKVLDEYTWRRGGVAFYRCRSCGCVTHYRRTSGRRYGNDMAAINMRNVDDLSIVAAVPIRALDGASSWNVLEERIQPKLWPLTRGAAGRPLHAGH
jgi:hypothetical protein